MERKKDVWEDEQGREENELVAKDEGEDRGKTCIITRSATKT